MSNDPSANDPAANDPAANDPAAAGPAANDPAAAGPSSPRAASVPVAALPPGTVGRAGPWTVAARRDGQVRAVSSRCRHQLADLSQGSLDADGCLVCPWHGARYDLDSGSMVAGPKGILWYRGKTPGYTQLVKAYGYYLKLRRRPVVRSGDAYVVQD